MFLVFVRCVMCVFECWLLCFAYEWVFLFVVFVFCRDYNDRVAYIYNNALLSTTVWFTRLLFYTRIKSVGIWSLFVVGIIFSEWQKKWFTCIIVSERSAVSPVSACHRVAAPVLLGKMGEPRLKNQSIQESNACVFVIDRVSNRQTLYCCFNFV